MSKRQQGKKAERYEIEGMTIVVWPKALPGTASDITYTLACLGENIRRGSVSLNPTARQREVL